MTTASLTEETYYKDDDVIITNARAIISGKTYVMANITSVVMQKIPPDNTWAIFIMLGGTFAFLMGLILMASRDNSGGICLVVGLIAAILSYLYIRSQKTQYAVRISASSGEQNALQSTDWVAIQKIVNAINEAIVRRG